MELYSVKDVARILKVSYQAALYRIRKGEIKATLGGDGSTGKRGSAYVIRKDDLDDYRKEKGLMPSDISEPEKAPETPARTITIKPQLALYDKDAVMKRIMMNNSWNYNRLSNALNMHSITVMSILNGKTRCTVEFIDKFADIFYLNRAKLYEAVQAGVDIEELEKPEPTTEPTETAKEPAIDISKMKQINDQMIEKLKKSGVELVPKTIADVQKYYYVITCYVRTKEGVMFDNIGFQKGLTNLATPKLFKTKEDAEAYIRNVIHGVCDAKNNSGCYYKIYVDERQLIVYKTIYDICRMEMSE